MKKTFIILSIVSFILIGILYINPTAQGEKMKIDNTDEWAKEITYLATLDVHTDKEVERFTKLIDMTDGGINDKKVVRTLMKIPYINDDIGGQIETIYSNLGESNYKLYYEVLFELMTYLDNDKDIYMSLDMLANYSGDVYTKEQWEEIYKIAWKYLDQDTINRILEYYEKDNPYTDYDDYPFPEFKELFIRLLKEKYKNHE